MSNNKLKITPLGGLGEIGLNCQIWETESGIVLVDCGLMFPDALQFGIDLVIPPIDLILKKRDKVKAIVLTHGHEDHIGALPWLVRYFEGLDIYGSRFTLALVENKLREKKLLSKVNLNIVTEDTVLNLCDMTFNFLPTMHSIPQSFGLGVETPCGKIIHTGDFKLGEARNSYLDRFEAFAQDDLLLLMSDSTNVESDGFSGTEYNVKNSLRQVFYNAKGRVIITLFSSHIERINSVFEMAKEFNRGVVISGRSLFNNIETAKNLGLLESLPPLYSDQELPDISDDRIIILATGSQGEPMSALVRITSGEHKQIKIREGDTVIMSSRAIPGNAQAVNRMINSMYKLGARVFHNHMHATGHAHKEELRSMLNLVKPKYFVPMHGEYRHLACHIELAVECGVKKENTYMLDDCEELVFSDNKVELGAKIAAPPILIDGKGIGDVGALILKERQLLGSDGVVVVSLLLDAMTNEIISGPEVISRGFVFTEMLDHIIEDSKCLVLDAVEARKSTDDLTKLSDKIRSSLRGFFRAAIGRDPIVLPMIIEL